MKKLLIGIFAFFVGFVSFSSAGFISIDWDSLGIDALGLGHTSQSLGSIRFINTVNITGLSFYINGTQNSYYTITDSNDNIVLTANCNIDRSYTSELCANIGYCCYFTGSVIFNAGSDYYLNFNYVNDNGGVYVQFSDSSLNFTDFVLTPTYYNNFNSSLGLYRIYYENYVSTPEITVYYNNGQTINIACNGDNIITIDGLSTMSSISTFTPYFNINYTDQNNQVLTDSYSNNILYLSGGQYLKTYTGGSNNDWILNLIGGSSSTGGFNIISSGLVVSGDIVSDNLSGNLFKNFIDTGFDVLFSNVPSYIQYVILIAILIIILRAFTKKRRKF